MLAPTLTTDRLILRAISLDDWDSYYAAWVDPDTTRYIGGTPRDRTTSWGKFLQGAGLWSILGFGYWSFVDRTSGAYIGSGGLAQFERGIESLVGHVESGWALAPSVRGVGYATEAMRAVLGWASDHLSATEIRAIIDHDNAASIRVAQKLGFTTLLPIIPELPESALWHCPAGRNRGG